MNEVFHTDIVAHCALGSDGATEDARTAFIGTAAHKEIILSVRGALFLKDLHLKPAFPACLALLRLSFSVFALPNTVGRPLIFHGMLKSREHATVGFQNTPAASIGLLQGNDTAKAVVKAVVKA